MTRRFRMVAGPNGSGKTTLAARLASDYSVNFYTMLNADDVFAAASRSRAWFPPYAQGGHDVPEAKIKTRYARSLENATVALPHLSRAFFFDNSGTEMKYLASYSKEAGFELEADGASDTPRWFSRLLSRA